MAPGTSARPDMDILTSRDGGTQFLSRLLVLFDQLAVRGRRVGLYEQGAVLRLAVELASQNLLAVEPMLLQNYLRPLLVKSIGDNSVFDAAFAVAFPQPFAPKRLSWFSRLITAKILTILVVCVCIVTVGTVGAGIWLALSKSSDETTIKTSVERPAAPRRQDETGARLQPVAPTQLETHRDVDIQTNPFWLLVALSLPVLTVLIVALLSFRSFIKQRKAHLIARSASHTPALQHLSVSEGPVSNEISNVLQAAVRLLLDAVRSPRAHLDLRRTTARTAEQGRFTPILYFRRATPQFLCLLGASAPHDNETGRFENLLQSLRSRGMETDTYYLDEESGLTYRDLSGPYYSLREMAQKFPFHVLLFFSGGTSLNRTGSSRNWMDDLQIWAVRAAFIPRCATEWHHRERVITQLFDGHLYQATSKGIHSFALALYRPALNVKPIDTQVLLRPSWSWEVRPRRWLSPAEPPDADWRALEAELKIFLRCEDDGQAEIPGAYLWLAACAVYPDIRWELTNYIGQRLTWDGGPGSAIATEDRAGRLTQLPWLREAWMPEWLRVKLIAQLPPLVRGQISALVTKLLERAAGDNVATNPISFSIASRSLPEPLRASRRDFVFMDFLARSRDIDFAAPAKLVQRLQEQEAPRPYGSAPDGLHVRATRKMIILLATGLGLVQLSALILVMAEFGLGAFEALAATDSFTLVFLPASSIALLILYRIPLQDLTLLLWRHVPNGKRFLIFALGWIVTGAIAGSAMNSHLAPAVWEVSGDLAIADQGGTCGSSASPQCTRVAMLESVMTLREASRTRWNMSDFNRTCRPDPLLEPASSLLFSRYCFAAGAMMPAATCCDAQSALRSTVNDNYRIARSWAGEAHKLTSSLLLSLVGLLFLALLSLHRWHRELVANFPRTAPSIELAAAGSAIVFALAPWFVTAGDQARGILMGNFTEVVLLPNAATYVICSVGSVLSLRLAFLRNTETFIAFVAAAYWLGVLFWSTSDQAINLFGAGATWTNTPFVLFAILWLVQGSRFGRGLLHRSWIDNYSD